MLPCDTVSMFRRYDIIQACHRLVSAKNVLVEAAIRSHASVQVTKKLTPKNLAKKSQVKAFVKLVNYNHIMPTRYQLDVDLKTVVTSDKLENSTKRLETRKVSAR